LLACMGEVIWTLHQALFQSQFHWRYLWILLSTWSWSFLVYLEGMLSSTNIFPSRKGQVFGYFKMPAKIGQTLDMKKKPPSLHFFTFIAFFFFMFNLFTWHLHDF
jgi:hypothetical protein